MSKNKIIYIITAIIILAGIIVGATLKFNFSLEYRESVRIDIYLANKFDSKDIKEISKEVFTGQDIIVEQIEVFGDMVGITVDTASEEQIDMLINKINEKYNSEILKQDIKIVSLPHMRLSDLLGKYAMPILISMIVVLAYMSIRYRKLAASLVVLNTSIKILLIELVYGSIIAITRLPINRYTIPTALFIGIIGLIYITNDYENKLIKKEEETTKKEKTT